MKPLRSVPVLVVGLLAVSACPGGVESRVCKRYFEQAEQCAAKAKPADAEAVRSMAKLAREGFTNQGNKSGVEEGCAKLLEMLQADPVCK
jgi:hypothetical protein